MKSQSNQNTAPIPSVIGPEFTPFVPKQPLSLEEISKINKDAEDIRCLNEDAGTEFMYVMKAFAIGVSQRNTSQFPQVSTNNNGTVVRLMLHKPCNDEDCEWGCGPYSDNRIYWRDLQQNFVIPQLEFVYRQLFPTVSDKPFCEVREAHGFREYQFNLSPEQLHEILMTCGAYSSYRHGGSVLLLSKQFEMKEGVICLFPVFPLSVSKENERDTKTAAPEAKTVKEYYARIAGCQFFELPQAQFLRLLPNYSGEEPGPKNTHGDISELMRSLPFFHYQGLLEEMMARQLMVKPDSSSKIEMTAEEIEEAKGLHEFTLDYSMCIVRHPKKNKGPLQIVPMDERAKRIYLLYGNCGAEELEHCLSFEVPLLSLLEEMKKSVESCLQTELSDESLQECKKSIATLEYMIEAEKNRLKNKVTAPTMWSKKSVSTGKGRVVLSLDAAEMNADNEQILQLIKEVLDRHLELWIVCKNPKLSEILLAAGLPSDYLDKIKFFNTGAEFKREECARYTVVCSENFSEASALGELVRLADPHTQVLIQEKGYRDIGALRANLDAFKKQHIPLATDVKDDKHTPPTP